MVPLALGSQTAGSIVRPAAFCGVFGLKPSFGTVDRRGVGPQAPSLDTVGWFARHAEDLALVLALRRHDTPADATRVAVVRTEHWDEADPDTRAAIETAAARLAGDGVEVGELTLPVDGLAAAQKDVQAYEADQTLGPLRTEHEAELSEAIRAFLDEGAAIPDERYAAALARAEAGPQPPSPRPSSTGTPSSPRPPAAPPPRPGQHRRPALLPRLDAARHPRAGRSRPAHRRRAAGRRPARRRPRPRPCAHRARRAPPPPARARFGLARSRPRVEPRAWHPAQPRTPCTP